MKGDVGIIMKNETAVAAKGSKASVGMMLLQNKEGLSGILSAPDSKNKDDFSASLPTLFADPTTSNTAVVP